MLQAKPRGDFNEITSWKAITKIKQIKKKLNGPNSAKLKNKYKNKKLL